MANEINNTEERVENLGPMVMKPTFDFRAAIKKAKKKSVDCGIFAHVEKLRKEKK